jgi:hypothetical protein
MAIGVKFRTGSYSAHGSLLLALTLGDEFLISFGKIGVVWFFLSANEKVRREGNKS